MHQQVDQPPSNWELTDSDYKMLVKHYGVTSDEIDTWDYTLLEERYKDMIESIASDITHDFIKEYWKENERN